MHTAKVILQIATVSLLTLTLVLMALRTDIRQDAKGKWRITFFNKL